MILKSFGCSFIYGSDLSDIDETPLNLYSPLSTKTWPSLLAQYYGYTYQCHARPGSGNLRILEKVLAQASESTSDDLFVIGWSWIDRYDYTIPIPNEYYKGDLAGNNLWCTVLPTDCNLKAQIYYKDLHSEFRDKFTSLINIKTAIDTLKQKNIPFIMSCIDKLVFDTNWHTSPAILDLQQYILPYIVWFEDKTFLEFSKEKGFNISKNLHPLEEAHQAGFELIKSYNLL